MEPSELARRIRVAREYGGFDSRPALAEAIGQAGLSAANLGRIERGERVPSDRDLKAIAEVCNVPTAWLTDESYDPMSFTVRSNGQPEDDRLAELHEMVTEGLDLLKQMRTEGIAELGEQVVQEVRKQVAQDSARRQRREDTK